MNRLSKVNKDKVAQFRAITGSSEKQALELLKHTNYMVEMAVDAWYSSGMTAPASSFDTRAVEALYQKYKDLGGDPDCITAEGVMQFCEDLGVEPADEVVLVIACHMQAATMGEFTRDEFVGGMQRMGCDTIDKLRKKLPELRAELKSPGRFKDIYLYAYTFSREKGTKCVQLDTATGMWQLLLGKVRPWQHLDAWLEFLTKHHNRAISKDTWSQLYDFIQAVRPDFSNYDDSSAWPYLLDEFVDHMRAKA